MHFYPITGLTAQYQTWEKTPKWSVHVPNELKEIIAMEDKSKRENLLNLHWYFMVSKILHRFAHTGELNMWVRIIWML